MFRMCRSFAKPFYIVLLALAVSGCQQQQEQPAVSKGDLAKQTVQQEHDARLTKQVEVNKKKSKSFNRGGSRTWQTYVP